MYTLMVILRLIHIIGGVFWVGTSLLFDFFIIPSIRAADEVGKKSFSQLLIKTHLGEVHGISAILAALAGAGLYWIDSQGFTSAWTRSAAGLGFGIGGIFGFFALISGILNAIPLRPSPRRLRKFREVPPPNKWIRSRRLKNDLASLAALTASS